MPVRYNQELLINVEIRDKCQILDDITIPLNRETKITYICQCSEKHSKNFRLIYNHGAFCKKCLSILTKDKVNQLVYINTVLSMHCNHKK